MVKHDLSGFPLPDLRHCTGAGEPLNPEVIEVWKDRYNLTIHDGYGQTETIILAANVPGMAVKPGSMGLPFPGHDLRVIDENLNETKATEVGELALRVKPERPPSLFLEYWKNPEETAAVFRGDYYLTGDQAYRDSDGYLWFVGRADDVISQPAIESDRSKSRARCSSIPPSWNRRRSRVPTPIAARSARPSSKLKPGAEPPEALKRENCKSTSNE